MTANETRRRRMAPRADLERALVAMTAVVGREWVRSGDQSAAYSDTYALSDTGRHAAAAAVLPQCTAEVQAVVRIATQHQVPLWPLSRGNNLGYGTAAALVAGSIVLDLRRMNRILEVDARRGWCVLEPGVGFIDLFSYLRGNDIPLWMSIPGNPSGSVLGNALERGLGYAPYGDHATKLCGFEVVLPDGSLVRTGMGAMGNSRCWHHYQPGFGPSWDQMFVQSNLGVVTRAGVWLMPEPEATLRARVSLPDFEALEWAVEALAQMRLRNLVEHPIVVANYLHEVAVVSQRSEWFCGDGTLPGEICRRIMEQHRLGWWNFPLLLFGYPEVIEAQAGVIRDLLGARLADGLRFDSWHRGDPIEHSAASVPSTLGLDVVNWSGGEGAHICFSPILPADGRVALEHARRSIQRFEQAGLDYCTSFTVGQRHITNVNTIIFNRADPGMVQRTRDLCGSLATDAAAYGFGEYRAHLDFMQRAADSFDYNQHALRKLNERVKDALDPAGILAPGKNGIWPRKYRD